MFYIYTFHDAIIINLFIECNKIIDFFIPYIAKGARGGEVRKWELYYD